jgi:hypothetical protein
VGGVDARSSLSCEHVRSPITSIALRNNSPMKATSAPGPVIICALLVLFCPTPCANAAQIVSICTFNCEFLNRPRVHIKYGLPFNLGNATPAEQAQWSVAGFRDLRFNEASAAVAGFLAAQNADVLALTEVGDLVDVAVLRTELANAGANYPHMAVCHSTDNTTGQHVAVLSRFALANTLDAIPGRESGAQATRRSGLLRIDPCTRTGTASGPSLGLMRFGCWQI